MWGRNGRRGELVEEAWVAVVGGGGLWEEEEVCFRCRVSQGSRPVGGARGRRAVVIYPSPYAEPYTSHRPLTIARGLGIPLGVFLDLVFCLRHLYLLRTADYGARVPERTHVENFKVLFNGFSSHTSTYSYAQRTL